MTGLPSSWFFLINNGNKSSMVKSYVSAIRAVLKDNGIKVRKECAELSSLIRACKLNNNRIQTRLPI